MHVQSAMQSHPVKQEVLRATVISCASTVNVLTILLCNPYKRKEQSMQMQFIMQSMPRQSVELLTTLQSAVQSMQL